MYQAYEQLLSGKVSVGVTKIRIIEKSTTKKDQDVSGYNIFLFMNDCN